jgi:hypothetical protein
MDFFRIERGLEIDESVQYLQGAGTPGASGDTSTAPVGSVYTDNTDGSIWTKISAGVGTNKWQRMASETYVNNALGATVSWREPAVVRDNVATTLPTGSASAPIVVDGVSITDGHRVLFSAITGGNGKNVYIYNQASGTFVEDTNAETSGDAVYVQSGTSAGKTFIFNGTAWVQSDQTSLDEEGYIRAFIGKTASGAEMPDYSSNNFVVDSSSLKAAVSALDAELGPNVSVGNFITPSVTMNVNLQALDTEIGANVSAGGFINPANTVNANLQALDTQLGVPLPLGNFITAGQHSNSAIVALDSELGPNVVNGNFIFAAYKINANIQALDTEIGANVIAGTYVVPTNSVNANVQALDTAVGTNNKQVNVANVTSIQTIDSVVSNAAKWLVRVENAADSTNVYATEVYAVSNGVTADYTKYATLKIGANIAGLAVTADLGSSGEIRVRVASTSAVNVSVRRVGVIA